MECGRTLNTGYCYDILLNKDIFDCISEDGAYIKSLDVDVIKDFWLELTDEKINIGVLQLKQIYAKTWEAHIHILPKMRKKYSKESGIAIWKWVEENLSGCTILVKIPSLYPNVINFVSQFDFERLPNPWILVFFKLFGR